MNNESVGDEPLKLWNGQIVNRDFRRDHIRVPKILGRLYHIEPNIPEFITHTKNRKHHDMCEPGLMHLLPV